MIPYAIATQNISVKLSQRSEPPQTIVENEFIDYLRNN